MNAVDDFDWGSAMVVPDAPLPDSAGKRESMIVGGLASDSAYSFAIKAVDENNWSQMSNIVVATTLLSTDSVSPSTISDLRVIDSATNQLTLSWTAPGDDGDSGIAHQYDMRYSVGSLLIWEVAAPVAGIPSPHPAGTPETLIVPDLEEGTSYAFGIKTVDENNNWSELSNVVRPTTLFDTTPPDAVTDLRVTDSTHSSVTLTWTAPGDDGASGTANLYSLRYSLSPIDETTWQAAIEVAGVPTPQPSGSVEAFTVTDLQSDTTYYFAIRTADDRMNWSPISDVVAIYLTHPVIWEKNIGGTGVDIANAVVISTGGSIVIAGQTNSMGAGDYDGYVVKIDSDGAVVWEKTFGGPAEDVVSDIVATPDGGFAAVGFTKSAGAGGNDGWLVKLNPSGTKVWEKTFGHTGEDVLNALVPTPDGGFAMVGTWNGNASLHYGAWVTKTSSSGLLEWQRSYKDAGEDCDNSRDISAGGGICFSHDGALVFSWHGEGDIYYPWPDDICLPNFVAAVLSKMSLSGVLVWSHIYTYMTYAESDCVVQTGDNGYASLSSVYGSGQSLAKVNINGELLWKVSSFTNGGVAHGLAGLSSGGIVLIGHTNYQTSGGLDAWISTIDPLGKTVGSLTVGGDADDRFHAVVQTSDGSIIAVGYTDSFSESTDIYVVKIRPRAD